MTFWNDNEDAILREKLALGWSLEEVACEIGNGRTRNSVISRARKLGISDRRMLKKVAKPKVATPHTKPRQLVVRRPPMQRVERKDVPPATGATVRYADSEDWQCRFIYGDDISADTPTCADRREPGQPYCAHHGKETKAPILRTPRQAKQGRYIKGTGF